MKKPFWQQLRSSSEVVACCALALAFTGACTGEIADTGSPGITGGGSSTPPPGSVAGDPTTPGAGTGAGAGTGVGTGGTPGAGGSAGPGPVVENPPPFQPAAGLLRRLTRAQFSNAVRDLLGVEVNVTEIEADNWTGNFASVGAAVVVSSDRGVEQYHAAIEKAVDAVFADATKRGQFIGCTPTVAATDACVRGFLGNLGLRAWRRPLEGAELDKLASLASKISTDLANPVEGVRWVTNALLTSPNFLYRPELGAATADGTRRFTGYEMASRLSFLLANTGPDKDLLDQAKSGMLATKEGIRTAATRLIDTRAGRAAVGAFAEEYMRLDRLLLQAKDSSLFPEYGPTLQAAMVRDMRETWETLAFDDKASALNLFVTPKVVVNAELAKLYGIDASGLDANKFEVRSLPADGMRVGILGKAGFLSQFANQKEGSPTLRGKFMRDALMCTPIPPPPGDADLVLDEPPADMPLTKRQRLELHRTSPACAGCHNMMDPLGLPLENFDAIGRFRTTDRGLPIDPTSEFGGKPVADARALGNVVASDLAVAQCMVRKYYSYAVGHEERDVDGSVLNALAERFQASGFQLRDLILEVVTNDAFSLVAPQP